MKMFHEKNSLICDKCCGSAIFKYLHDRMMILSFFSAKSHPNVELGLYPTFSFARIQYVFRIKGNLTIKNF